MMRYQISGKQIDIGEALQTHVKAELGKFVEKYANDHRSDRRLLQGGA